VGVSGMGKTGIIGRKIGSNAFIDRNSVHVAATAPKPCTAIWGKSRAMMHAYHFTERRDRGDHAPLPLVRKLGVKIIAMTGNVKSSLAKHSDVVLNVKVDQEGCPLGLAPMASTTATLVLGDALAACLIDRRGFRKEDFAFYHPGGSLGRRLLLKVEDMMRKGNHFAKVPEDMKVKMCFLRSLNPVAVPLRCQQGRKSRRYFYRW